MEERCDQFPNCQDFSDEANCQLVVRPDNYVADYAPFVVNDDGDLVKVGVKIKMDLISILDINEVGQNILVQFKLYISWYDFRLKFFNMKTNINMNTLTTDEKESIWVPVIVFRKQNCTLMSNF